jgi:hypothetical protein
MPTNQDRFTDSFVWLMIHDTVDCVTFRVTYRRVASFHEVLGRFVSVHFSFYVLYLALWNSLKCISLYSTPNSIHKQSTDASYCFVSSGDGGGVVELSASANFVPRRFQCGT